MKLLCQVITGVDIEVGLGVLDLVDVEGPLGGSQAAAVVTDDIGNRVSRPDLLASLGIHPQGHLNVGKALLVWVVLGVLGQLLCDTQVRQSDTAGLQVCRKALQLLVDLGYPFVGSQVTACEKKVGI